jgi:3-oxoacyl-[acyl-carrier-protein] synthase II
MTRPDADRVVITGVGLVTPLGTDRESTWRRLVAGDSAVTRTGARVPLETSGPRATAWALRAAEEAVSDAGLPTLDPERCGSVVSGSKPLLGDFGGGLSVESAENVSSAVARWFAVEGPVMTLAAACATGIQSVLVGAGWIREGRADVVLAGAAESSFHPLYQAGFDQLGVLSRTGRVRPFDRGRDGFVLGEGAGVFVLENLRSARARGAHLYGEVAGGDFSCDAHHATRFNSEGRRMAACLARSLSRSGAEAAHLDYINAHGTATPLNDALESRALASLGTHCPPLRVSSTKGATGHMLGATGAVELGFVLLAMRDGRLPPTLNLDTPEISTLDFIPHHARSARVDRAASLSFGFGGALASIVMERVL